MLLFLGMATTLAADHAGIFQDKSTFTDPEYFINTPSRIFSAIQQFSLFTMFLIPIFIGVSVYRDFKCNIHTVLYSYPIKKRAYLGAKFLSALFVVTLIVAMIGLGTIIGFRLPGVNHAAVGPLNVLAYHQIYGLFIIPNIIIIGTIVFAIVTISRNVYAGFIAVLIIVNLQNIISGFGAGIEGSQIREWLDPTGRSAVMHYVKYWTADEIATKLLPIKSIVLFNRLLWLGVAGIIGATIYHRFTFSQNPLSLYPAKKNPARSLLHQFASITKITLPEVRLEYSLKHQVKTTWRLSIFDFRFIITSWPFIALTLVAFLIVIYNIASDDPAFGTLSLPITWRVLELPLDIIGNFGTILTFLYAGVLVNRSKVSRMDQLIDTTPINDWALIISKVLAIFKMQAFLLLLLLIGGVLVQLSKGYFNLELDVYIIELFLIKWPELMVWGLAAIFFQTFFANPYLGFFFLLFCSMGIESSQVIGIEEDVYRPNYGPMPEYSDMDGYGRSLIPYYAYKMYWGLSVLCLLAISYLIWKRGLLYTLTDRMKAARRKLTPNVAAAIIICLTGFIGLGVRIYLDDHVYNQRINTEKELELWSAESEKRYKQFEKAPQPMITAIKLDMDIYPESRSFHCKGEYILVNKTRHPIDTILVNYSFKEKIKYQLDVPSTIISKDTNICIDVIRLENMLFPGDSLQMTFDLYNKPNTLFRNYSKVRENGTFLSSRIFPGIGYRDTELKDNSKRLKYGLKPIEGQELDPMDEKALQIRRAARGWEMINFEAIVRTSADQIGIAPGQLIKRWTEDGRNHFHYKLKSKIKPNFGFHSGRYSVEKRTSNGIQLEVYFHEGHDYNITNLMDGLEASLAYNIEHFGPYQHQQARIIEFPRSEGTFATVLGDLIPFSESRFIYDVDENTGTDLPFYIAAHEIAHMWWGHQVVPEDIPGAKMVTESLAEYIAAKVLEYNKGMGRKRNFLKYQREFYMQLRARGGRTENPLMFNEGRRHISYNKGAIIFCAMSDYIGESKFNEALKKFLMRATSGEDYFPTSTNMVEEINKVTPDTLKYLIKDLFQTVTLSDNRLLEAKVRKQDDDKFLVTLDFAISKYRVKEEFRNHYSENGKDSLVYKSEKVGDPIYSLPLDDFIEIGIFGEQGPEGEKKIIYQEKHRIRDIMNSLSILVPELPSEAAIDPFNLLIDKNITDNRKKIIAE
ncbi:MAG: M1 family aminopeptidase [Bacteroidota bacterium]